MLRYTAMKLSRTHVIALSNQKGGCGKSTSAVSLAAALSHLGLSTCVVDTDPQCNSTDHLGLDRDGHAERGGFTLADAYLAKRPADEVRVYVPADEDDAERAAAGEMSRPWLVPGNRGLGTVEKRLEAEMHAALAGSAGSPLDADDVRGEHRHRLRQSLDTLRGEHDIVIVDTPPELGFLMTTALIAADWYLIPVFPSGYDMKGLSDLTRTAEKVRARYNPNLRLLGVLLGNFNHVAKLDRDIFERLRETFGAGVVFDTPIHTSVRHREATVYNRTIFEHAPDQPPSKQFLKVARQLVARLESGEEKGGRPELTIHAAAAATPARRRGRQLQEVA